LGLGSQESHSRPARVKLPKTGVRELSLGVDHAAAITLQDELFLWGKGSLLGEVQNVLQPKRFLIEGSSHFKLVVCGELETFLVDKAGHLLAWGSNRYGQLGLGQQSGLHVAAPSHVKPLHEPVTDIVSGGNFTIASLESGDVCAWGNQTCGRLGLVETKDERICWEPSLVVATWSTVATAARPQQSRKTVRSSKDTESVAGKTEKSEETATATAKGTKDRTQNVVSFVILQTVLKQEDTNQQESALKKDAEEFEQMVQELIQEIRSLRDEE
ncbi:HERC4, partial [Symbiodinium necroappetens]